MKPVLLTAIAVTLSACSVAPTIDVGPNPSDFSSSVKPSLYGPVTAGTIDYRPVEPQSWIERNKRVAPRTGSE
ncbi:hypothetical protein [Ancylobacter amanitiformis]|uniref:Uncharacterized protein n=1 Tax=Ancylobacter amanitiformis TaxID=217069 RepID=A0ABU0LWX2_9HYPH|nr:hypothetical protein [Ancylobacter amanitiformis]MDQ0513189.1 hypothetical protein [Ancylobacter amanitiformis]